MHLIAKTISRQPNGYKTRVIRLQDIRLYVEGHLGLSNLLEFSDLHHNTVIYRKVRHQLRLITPRSIGLKANTFSSLQDLLRTYLVR